MVGSKAHNFCHVTCLGHGLEAIFVGSKKFSFIETNRLVFIKENFSQLMTFNSKKSFL